MLKVKILPHLGGSDLGIEKHCQLGTLCLSNSHSVLCALSRKHQLVLSVLVPGPRTEKATVSQTTICYLALPLGLKVSLNKVVASEM